MLKHLLFALLVQVNPSAAAQFEYTVRDAATGQPVPFVHARIAPHRADLPQFNHVGNADGRVVFSVPTGDTIDVTLSAIGYETWTLTVIVAGTVARATVWISPRPIEVEGVSATVERVELAVEQMGFYQRRSLGAGVFLDPEDLQRVQATQPSDFFRRIPSIRITDREPVFTRGGSGFDGSCWPLLILDGMVVRAAKQTHISLDDLVPVGDIAAIEAYPSGTGAPSEYSGTGAACGVIMIWTKR